jgi:DNA-directed RNA polymerase I subunit RPA2
VVRYKGLEDAVVERVTVCGAESGQEEMQRVCLTLRIPRNPIIGDKFSSRHGQKGVCSRLYPSRDMPYSESGIQPDIIINPHAFPSRMTIGMFVESMAAKAGALHGLCQDSTPFSFSEDRTAVDYFGCQLREAGYNYYGNEPMYSGINGIEMRADIYIGVIINAIITFYIIKTPNRLFIINVCVIWSRINIKSVPPAQSTTSPDSP